MYKKVKTTQFYNIQSHVMHGPKQVDFDLISCTWVAFCTKQFHSKDCIKSKQK